MDNDFLKSYNNCNRENSVNFADQNDKNKIEFLIKSFFIVFKQFKIQLKTEKQQTLSKFNFLKKEVDYLRNNQESLVSEKIGKYSQENYFLQCELEEIKNKFQQFKDKKEIIDKSNEENILKLEKFKEKFKDKENLYYKAVLEKNELEKKLENSIFKVYIKIKKKIKNELSQITQKSYENEKENEMLKSDIEYTRIKNEEYIIKIAEINSLYQESCDRNIILEKISKYSKLNHDNDDFSSQM